MIQKFIFCEGDFAPQTALGRVLVMTFGAFLGMGLITFVLGQASEYLDKKATSSAEVMSKLIQKKLKQRKTSDVNIVDVTELEPVELADILRDLATNIEVDHLASESESSERSAEDPAA